MGNAGKAEVKGLELASRQAINDDWRLEGSLAWTDGKLKEDAPALGPSGAKLPNSAWLSVSLGARYAFALAGKPSYASLQVRHVGKRNAGYDSDTTSIPNFVMPAYTLVDAQWGMDFGAWQLSAFVRNLTDKRASSAPTPPSPPSAARCADAGAAAHDRRHGHLQLLERRPISHSTLRLVALMLAAPGAAAPNASARRRPPRQSPRRSRRSLRQRRLRRPPLRRRPPARRQPPSR